MVDVGDKLATLRRASARALVRMAPDTAARVVAGDAPKGDVISTARIAGIQAAKRTPDLVPLCHPIAIHGVEVDLVVEHDGVHLSATVRTADRTGVEMEALTCVAVAGLALVDMVKALDRGATITDVRVEHKSGGRSGEWRRSDQRSGGSSAGGSSS